MIASNATAFLVALVALLILAGAGIGFLAGIVRAVLIVFDHQMMGDLIGTFGILLAVSALAGIILIVIERRTARG